MLALSGLLVTSPTLAQEPAWPSPAELRQELADDGWEWAASSWLWAGGRGRPIVNLSITSPLYVSIHDVTLRGSALLSWEEQQAMGWTAFMEIAERVPIYWETLRAIHDQLGEAVCLDYPLVGGMLTFDARVEPGAITIAEGGARRCDGPEETLPPEAEESMAASAS